VQREAGQSTPQYNLVERLPDGGARATPEPVTCRWNEGDATQVPATNDDGFTFFGAI
jgi:hypothetical protein